MSFKKSRIKIYILEFAIKRLKKKKKDKIIKLSVLNPKAFSKTDSFEDYHKDILYCFDHEIQKANRLIGILKSIK